MKYRIFLDSFSGEIADLKRGKRTRENMLSVLARSPLVSTWDMSEYRWLRDEIANMETDGLITSVDQPYPWLRYELTDKGRTLMTPNASLSGASPLFGEASARSES
jgi:DNA-binding HxlR family transcriptional regulator